MKTALILLAIAAVARPSDACSTISFPPGRVPTDTVAFEGVVVGYSVSAVPVLGASQVSGLAVRVVTPLLASRADTPVEVYLFGSAPDCSPSARSLDDLREQYPVGAAVTVIGRASDPRPPNAAPPFVVSLADDWGHVAVVPATPPRTTEDVLDFGRFSRQHEEQPSQGFLLPVAWRNAHRTWYEDFEYLRCLVLLSRMPDDTRKVAVLENLRSYPRLSPLTSIWAQETYREIVASARLPRSAVEHLLSFPPHQ